MMLALIVAAAENGVIGRDNALPWHLPEDLKYFRRTTIGKPVIMGRRTFESIGKALPERLNIVVSRSPGVSAPDVLVVSTLDAALAAARTAATGDLDEALVIGGAQLYRAALPLARRIYLTEVHAAVEGDTFLPPVDWDKWREARRETHTADQRHAHDFSFVIYERTEG